MSDFLSLKRQKCLIFCIFLLMAVIKLVTVWVRKLVVSKRFHKLFLEIDMVNRRLSVEKSKNVESAGSY